MFIMMLQELADKEGVEYIPGGATQNSVRVAQWVLQSPGATSYFGCIGSDDFGAKMRENATKDGVNVSVSVMLLHVQLLVQAAVSVHAMHGQFC
jgi:adenosine kinase